MARLARLVVPGLAHHVTQRGNGRAQTFFGDADYALYRDLLAASCRKARVEVWACVLMPNHVRFRQGVATMLSLYRPLADVAAIYDNGDRTRILVAERTPKASLVVRDEARWNRIERSAS